MTVRQILKMGDERLLRKAQAIKAFNTPDLLAGIADMKETMIAANGAGLAAPHWLGCSIGHLWHWANDPALSRCGAHTAYSFDQPQHHCFGR